MDYTFVGMIFVWIFCIFLNAWLARKKGYGTLIGLIAGLLLPLWSVLVMVLIPNRNKPDDGSSSFSGKVVAGSLLKIGLISGGMTVMVIGLIVFGLWFAHL